MPNPITIIVDARAGFEQLQGALQQLNSKFGAFFADVRSRVSAMQEVNAQFEAGAGALEKLAGSFEGLLGVAELSRFAGDAIAAARSMAQLNAVIKSSGNDSAAFREELEAQRDAMGKATGKTDEALVSVQRLLLSFGVTRTELPKLTELTLDYAAVMGIDTAQAAEVLGRALSGGTVAIRGMPIPLELATTRTEKLALMQEALTKRTGEQALAIHNAAPAIDDFRKGLEETEKAAGDLVLRDLLTPFLKRLGTGLESVREFLKSFNEQWPQLSQLIREAAGSMGGLVSAVGPVLLGMGILVTVVGSARIAMFALAPALTLVRVALAAMGGVDVVGLLAMVRSLKDLGIVAAALAGPFATAALVIAGVTAALWTGVEAWRAWHAAQQEKASAAAAKDADNQFLGSIVRTLEAAKQAGVISDEAYQGFRKQAIGLVTAQLSAADYHKELVKLAGALREVKIAGSGPSRTGQDGDQAAVEQALLERRLNFLKAQAAAQSAQAGLPGIAALQDLQLAAAERDYKLGLLAFEDYVTKRRQMLEASATAELAVIDATRKAADLETKQRTAELAAAQQGGRPDEIAKATEALNKAKVEEEKLSSATTAALVKEARANIELAQAEEEHRRALEAVRLENAAAAAEVKISALEGDPYLTRLDIQDALLKALKDRAAAVDGLIAHYQKLRDAASDAAQKEEFQSKIIGLQGEQQGIGRKIQDTEDSASIGKQMQRAMTQLRAEGENIAKNLADVFKNTIGAAIDSISRGISGLILGTKTWGQALREIGTSVLNTIIEGIIKAGLQWVVSELFKAAEGKAIAAAQLAALAPIAAAQSAIWAFPATLATIASFGVAADQAPALIAAAEFETLFTAAFAEGGRPGVGQVSLVGERGPELFVPDSAGTILPAGTTAAILRDSGGQRVSGGSQRSASPTNMHLAIITDEAKLPAWTNQAHGEAWVVRVAQKNAHKIQGPRG